MANEEHLAILRQGVEVWNEWRERNLEVKPELSSSNFSSANLREANFSSAELSSVDFSSAYLHLANFSSANLREANFKSSSLYLANFSSAYLYLANFRLAYLKEAKFSSAFLHLADFSSADLDSANLSLSDLYSADLNWANLSTIQALGTNFTAANFTGACIEDWNINRATNLERVICDFIYLKKGSGNDDNIGYEHLERRPSDREIKFLPGEFTKIFQKIQETVDSHLAPRNMNVKTTTTCKRS
jgi:hypothetical protein